MVQTSPPSIVVLWPEDFHIYWLFPPLRASPSNSTKQSLRGRMTVSRQTFMTDLGHHSGLDGGRGGRGKAGAVLLARLCLYANYGRRQATMVTGDYDDYIITIIGAFLSKFKHLTAPTCGMKRLHPCFRKSSQTGVHYFWLIGCLYAQKFFYPQNRVLFCVS